MDSFTKPHLFQKINIDFEKQFCKHLYFRLQINEAGADEDADDQDQSVDQKFIKLLINFGQDNFNEKIRRQLYVQFKNKKLNAEEADKTQRKKRR